MTVVVVVDTVVVVMVLTVVVVVVRVVVVLVVEVFVVVVVDVAVVDVVVVVVVVEPAQALHSTGHALRNCAASTLPGTCPLHMWRLLDVHVGGSTSPLHAFVVLVVVVVLVLWHRWQSAGQRSRRRAASVGDTAVTSSHCDASDSAQSGGS